MSDPRSPSRWKADSRMSGPNSRGQEKGRVETRSSPVVCLFSSPFLDVPAPPPLPTWYPDSTHDTNAAWVGYSKYIYEIHIHSLHEIYVKPCTPAQSVACVTRKLSYAQVIPRLICTTNERTRHYNTSTLRNLQIVQCASSSGSRRCNPERLGLAI